MNISVLFFNQKLLKKIKIYFVRALRSVQHIISEIFKLFNAHREFLIYILVDHSKKKKKEKKTKYSCTDVLPSD